MLLKAVYVILFQQMMHNDEIPQLNSGSQRGIYGEAGLRFTEVALAETTRPTLHGT